MYQIECNNCKEHWQAVQVKLELLVAKNHVGRGHALAEFNQAKDDALLCKLLGLRDP